VRPGLLRQQARDMSLTWPSRTTSALVAPTARSYSGESDTVAIHAHRPIGTLSGGAFALLGARGVSGLAGWCWSRGGMGRLGGRRLGDRHGSRSRAGSGRPAPALVGRPDRWGTRLGRIGVDMEFGAESGVTARGDDSATVRGPGPAEALVAASRSGSFRAGFALRPDGPFPCLA
jgi:hypothetical protein